MKKAKKIEFYQGRKFVKNDEASTLRQKFTRLEYGKQGHITSDCSFFQNKNGLKNKKGRKLGRVYIS